MATEGVEETLALYEAARNALSASLADVAHDAIVAEYQRRASRIPVETGALRKALTDQSDRAHSAEVTATRKGWALAVGVRGSWSSDQVLRASVFQRDRIPQPVSRRVVGAIHAAYEAGIGAVATGDRKLGDIGVGKIRRANPRRRRRRGGRGARQRR